MTAVFQQHSLCTLLLNLFLSLLCDCTCVSILVFMSYTSASEAKLYHHGTHVEATLPHSLQALSVWDLHSRKRIKVLRDDPGGHFLMSADLSTVALYSNAHVYLYDILSLQRTSKICTSRLLSPVRHLSLSLFARFGIRLLSLSLLCSSTLSASPSFSLCCIFFYHLSPIYRRCLHHYETSQRLSGHRLGHLFGRCLCGHAGRQSRLLQPADDLNCRGRWHRTGCSHCTECPT